METSTSRNGIANKPERHKTSAQRLSATEIRRLPKSERDRILKAQFQRAKDYYAEHPGIVIPGTQDVVDY